MGDELAHWAAARAPELLARAEERAVEELSRALVAAALAGDRASAPAPERAAAERGPAAPERAAAEPDAAQPQAAAAGEPAPETGEGLWLYCVAAADADLPTRAPGVHPGAPLLRVDHAGLTALAGPAPLAEFGAAALRDNLNDLAWLERVARAHEDVLEAALARATIVPLRLCTIYRDEAGVRRMLEEERATLHEALERLAGHEEWGVKLIVDREALRAAGARAAGPEAGDDAPEPGAGGAYLLRRRREREARAEADRLVEELAEDVHARLLDWASDAALCPPQNRELSGHEGEMVLNGAYLVPTERVDGLRELVVDLGKRHVAAGARLELTGPWPPYNFVGPREEPDRG